MLLSDENDSDWQHSIREAHTSGLGSDQHGPGAEIGSVR